jgi:hypothetical protein
MNLPGTVKTNWRWRLLPGLLTKELGKEVLAVTKRFGRANWDALNALEEKRKSKRQVKKKKVSNNDK